tara:strand:+ start:34608 stop:34964 length:357 start_codon:yes stop_codon:yes gene_type:complete
MKTPIQLLSITRGADYEIDLTGFAEPEPSFAYVDDVGSKVQVLSGLVEVGRITIEGQPDFMWLEGARDGVLLKALPGGHEGEKVAFRSLGIGEFCLEIYHVGPNGAFELLRQDDFCFK